MTADSVWADLVGQDAAVAQLAAAARDSVTGGPAMTHAWLITGPPGSGRSNAARALAAALLSPDQGASRGPEANRALAGAHESMTVMRTQKSVITIDEVRDLVTSAQNSPVNARYRVVVIEDADRMAERTSNVLLKAIEEPPPATVWILCAPSPQDVLTTIRSRCRNVNLRIPPTDAIAELLVRRDGVEPERARWAAAAAQNHIGRARYLATSETAPEARRRTLDIPRHLGSLGSTVRLAARIVEEAEERAEARTKEKAEAARAKLLETLGVEPGKNPPPSVRAQVRRFEEDQKRKDARARSDEIDSILLELLSLYRDVLSYQLGRHEGFVNLGEEERIRDMAEASDPTSTLRRIDVIGAARERLQTNMPPLLVVESAFVGLSNPWLVEPA
ncbi:DNA polymerase III subunit delta' [Brevibacterium litoralis]|uniref:DNA polymerase III subunit delta' n=1 Tax=Brevibacterium litoralis TaxID=3138935 RepID=UPI0032EFB370